MSEDATAGRVSRMKAIAAELHRVQGNLSSSLENLKCSSDSKLITEWLAPQHPHLCARLRIRYGSVDFMLDEDDAALLAVIIEVDMGPPTEGDKT